VARSVFDRLVVRQNLQKVVGVATVRSEHHAAPELVDADRPQPAVLALVELFQMQPGVRVTGELVEGSHDRRLHGFLQLRVIVQEIFVDREARHPCMPLSAAVAGSDGEIQRLTVHRPERLNLMQRLWRRLGFTVEVSWPSYLRLAAVMLMQVQLTVTL
jgi:hypothetical protein